MHTPLTEGNYLTRANVLEPQLKELREAVRGHSPPHPTARQRA